MENFEEQPIELECNSLEKSNINNGTDSDGSSLGKFKNSDELLKAYNNLEKEFTKKCQKIKQLEAQNDNATTSPDVSDNERIAPISANQSETDSIFVKKSIKDIFKFVAKNGINESMSQDCGVSINEVKHSENEVSTEDFVMTEDLKSAILANADLRNRFIENYLNEIQSQKTTPLMVNSASSNFCVMPKSKPQNLQDAGDYVKEMLKN